MKSAVHFTFSRGEPMIKKTLVNVGVAALLGGMAVAAQAATVTFPAANSPNPTFWTFGNGNAVNVVTPTYNGSGGAFNATISGATGSQQIFNGLFSMYCVDLIQFIGFSGSYTDYSIVTSVSFFGDSKALELAKLLTYGNSQVASYGDKDFASTALQLAIWNTLQDTDQTLSSGSFKNTSTPVSSVVGGLSLNALADSYISGAVGATNQLQLFVLKSPTQQDQIIWLDGGVPGGGNIPEPTSLALAFGALGALGFATRRRKITSS